MIYTIFKKEWLSIFDNLVHWSELNQLKKESVSSHSYKVVCLTRIISEEIFTKDNFEMKLACIDYATFHDWDEIFIKRDMSHRTKYNDFNGAQLRKILDELVVHLVSENIGGKTPASLLMSQNILKEGLLKGVKEVVKTADWLALIHHCMIELQMGNNTFYPKLLYALDKLELSIEQIRLCLGIWNNEYLDDIEKFGRGLKTNLENENKNQWTY
jgi:5'-deoxynucleotidase YfbR-like HD superfamily hydrolase